MGLPLTPQFLGGPSTQCNLSDAMWIASSMFNSVSKKFLTKRVFLFTNDDNPDGDNRELQEKSQQRAQVRVNPIPREI